MRLTIEEAKRLLRIPDLWRRIGLPGQPKKSCRCPWREDKRASFSVSAEGHLWHDFATGEGGDAIDFLQRATGLSKQAACRKFIEMAGGRLSVGVFHTMQARRTERQTARADFMMPQMRLGTESELRTLASIRTISLDGIQLAQEHGLLRFGTWCGRKAWFVTDGKRRCAQARRLDGRHWRKIDSKAWTICPPGFGSWPVGAMESELFPTIVLCEGGPDLLAACHFICLEQRKCDVAPVTMLGAGHHIHAHALSCFAGKRVRIFGHTDNAGRNAVQLWARQLRGVGADVDAFDLGGIRKVTGEPVTDLNDCSNIDADDFENERDLWRLLP